MMKQFIARYARELKSRLLTRSTVLLLLYVFAVNTTTVVAIKIPQDLRSPIESECSATVSSPGNVDSNIGNLYSYGLYVLIPLAGWIGDSKIGRGSALTISLVTGWLGTILLSVSSSIQYILCGNEPIQVLFMIAKYGLSPASLLLLMVSVSFCYANVFGFGMSQLLVSGASSVKLRAFIHWAIWLIFASGNVTYLATEFATTNPYMGSTIISLFSCIIFTLCLCLHFNLRHWFQELKIGDSYRLLWGVLWYAWKQKYPENRSSLTYWQDEEPSRIDFAKSIFGGPFTNESVETVKTFLRILAILVSLFPFLLAYDPLVNEITEFVPQYKGGASAMNGQAGTVVWFIGDDIILIMIPLLEFIILPIFPKFEYFLINPLRGIGMSMIFLIGSACGLFLIDLIGHINSDVICYSIWTPVENSPVPISFWVLLIPSILAGIADMLSYLYIFAFLCSQAPTEMSGMVIGIFWFSRGICIEISAAILLAFEKLTVVNRFSSHYLSCTSLLMFILGGIAFIGLIIYILTAKWYTKRIRNEDLNLRFAVERHYEQHVIFSEQQRNENNYYFSISSDVSSRISMNTG